MIAQTCRRLNYLKLQRLNGNNIFKSLSKCLTAEFSSVIVLVMECDFSVITSSPKSFFSFFPKLCELNLSASEFKRDSYSCVLLGRGIPQSLKVFLRLESCSVEFVECILTYIRLEALKVITAPGIVLTDFRAAFKYPRQNPKMMYVSSPHRFHHNYCLVNGEQFYVDEPIGKKTFTWMRS